MKKVRALQCQWCGCLDGAGEEWGNLRVAPLPLHYGIPLNDGTICLAENNAARGLCPGSDKLGLVICLGEIPEPATEECDEVFPRS